MGLVGEIFGESKTYVPPAAKVPEKKLLRAERERLLDIYANPLGSLEFQTFQRGLGDQLATSRSQLLDAIAAQTGAPGGPGTESGFAQRARLGADVRIGQAGAGATREFISDLLARRSSDLRDFWKMRADYAASTYATRVGGTRETYSPGLLDYVGKIGSTMSSFGKGVSDLGPAITTIGSWF